MTYIFPVYAPAYLINLILTSLVAVIAFRRRGAPGAMAFTAVMVLASIWSFAQFFESGATTAAGRMFWSGVQYIGAAGLPATWLLFAARYSGVRLVEGRRVILLYIIPAITLLLVWTNSLHHLIWTEVTLINDPIPYAIYDHGLWFWINAAYGYTVVITGAGLLIREAIYAPRLHQRQTLALVAGAIAPLLANLIYVLDVSPWPGLDLTSFAFTFTGLLYLPAMVSLRVLDLMPVARGSVIEQMTDAMIVTDAQLRVADINPPVRELLGLDTTDWIGMPLQTALAGLPELAAMADGQQPAQAIVPVRKGSHLHFLDARKSVLTDRRNQPIGFVFLMHDITRLKAAEQQSFDLALEQERVRLLSRFIRDASHEFRTPLAVINTSLYLLVRAPDGDARHAHREKIGAQVARIDHLLDEMLTMSRLDEREPLSLTDLDVNALLRDVVAAHSVDTNELPSITVEAADSLPSVRGDEAQLERAFDNLIENALTHTGADGTIRIGTEARNGQVVITLSDTGAGMDAVLQRRVFERFFRTDDAHTTPGFGLGLPMARAIIEAHGGTIELASVPGEGSTFTVQLPALAKPAAPDENRPIPPRLAHPLRPTTEPAAETHRERP